MIKVVDKQPDEELHKTRSGRVLSIRASIPVELSNLPACGCVHQSGSSLNPIPLGFLWRLHHIGMINCKLNF